jgi:hypothetical protein
MATELKTKVHSHWVRPLRAKIDCSLSKTTQSRSPLLKNQIAFNAIHHGAFRASGSAVASSAELKPRIHCQLSTIGTNLGSIPTCSHNSPIAQMDFPNKRAIKVNLNRILESRSSLCGADHPHDIVLETITRDIITTLNCIYTIHSKVPSDGNVNFKSPSRRHSTSLLTSLRTTSRRRLT